MNNNAHSSMALHSKGYNTGDMGATLMSESLKTNTTLAVLDLGCIFKK